MSKKIIIMIVVAVLIVAIVAGAAVYYFLLRKPAEVPEEAKVTPEERVRLTLTDEEESSGMTLEEKIAKIEKDRRLALERGEDIEPIELDIATIKSINEDEVMATTLSADGKSLYYYDPTEGELYMSNLDGSNSQAITSADFQNVYDVEWSDNKDKAIFAFSEDDGESKTYALFDLNTQQTVTYSENYQAVTLSPDQDQIAYVYYDEENDLSNVSVADPYNTADYQSIYYYPRQNVDITWLDDNSMAIGPDYKDISGYEENNLMTEVRKDNSTYRTCAGEQFSISMVKEGLSPNKKRLIFNQSDIKNPRSLGLYVVDERCLEKPQNLNIGTMASKCAWAKDNKHVYCGVPDFWPNNMVMPNDYIDGKFISTDSFYKINTETLVAEIIASSTDFVDIFDVKANGVSKDNKIFYFQNRVDSQTYALNIPSGMIGETHE